MHYFKNVQAGRQAAGVRTNFDPATWAPQVTPLVNDLFIALGTRAVLTFRGVTLERYDDLLAMLGFETADPARRASCSAG